jgi:hypothetical protein
LFYGLIEGEMMEKTCVIRGEGFRLKAFLKQSGFTFDTEAKVWFQVVEVDDSGRAAFSIEDQAIELMNTDELKNILELQLWKPKKIEVSFE